MCQLLEVLKEGLAELGEEGGGELGEVDARWGEEGLRFGERERGVCGQRGRG